jgi:hypothetical protein
MQVEQRYCIICGKPIRWNNKSDRAANYAQRLYCLGKGNKLSECQKEGRRRWLESPENQEKRKAQQQQYNSLVKEAYAPVTPYESRNVLSEEEIERLNAEQRAINKAIDNAIADRKGYKKDNGRSLPRAEIDALVAQGAITPVSQIRGCLLHEYNYPGLSKYDNGR